MLLPYFAERAAQNLISRQAVIAEAQRIGLRVSDDEVRDELQHGRYSNTFFRVAILSGTAIPEHFAERGAYVPALSRPSRMTFCSTNFAT